MQLALICGRGGSKGSPGKNLWRLDGEPLVARAVRQAVESAVFDVVAVSSDDGQILEAGLAAGASLAVRRPDALSGDDAGKLDVLRHAVQVVEASSGQQASIVVDLDITTPLRAVADIRDVVQRLSDAPSAVEAVFTCSPARRSPWFNLVVEDDRGAPTLPCPSEFTRRQDCPTAYDLSGAVYAWKRQALMRPGGLLSANARLHVIPEWRAWDIDTDLDRVIVEALLAAGKA